MKVGSVASGVIVPTWPIHLSKNWDALATVGSQVPGEAFPGWSGNTVAIHINHINNGVWEVLLNTTKLVRVFLLSCWHIVLLSKLPLGL